MSINYFPLLSRRLSTGAVYSSYYGPMKHESFFRFEVPGITAAIYDFASLPHTHR